MAEKDNGKRQIKGQRFVSLYLENWRNFLKVDIQLQRRVFLIGPNASGKSNLLDVFRFLHDIAASGAGGIQQAVKKRGGVSAIRCLAARQNPDVVIRVEVAGERETETGSYELRFSQDNLRRPFVRSERVIKNGLEIFQPS